MNLRGHTQVTASRYEPLESIAAHLPPGAAPKPRGGREQRLYRWRHFTANQRFQILAPCILEIISGVARLLTQPARFRQPQSLWSRLGLGADCCAPCTETPPPTGSTAAPR